VFNLFSPQEPCAGVLSTVFHVTQCSSSFFNLWPMEGLNNSAEGLRIEASQ
jgi:hypothetical protein